MPRSPHAPAAPRAADPAPTKRQVLAALSALAAADAARAHPIETLARCPDAATSARLLTVAVNATRQRARSLETAGAAGGRREPLVAPALLVPPLC